MQILIYFLHFFRGDHIVPNMDEAFPKKKVEGDNSIDRVSCHTFSNCPIASTVLLQLNSKVLTPPSSKTFEPRCM